MAKILITDDDNELCQMLCEYLQSEGFSVEIAANGLAAIEKIRADTFDAVLLDIMMPEHNGFDVLRELRKHSNTPVLVLTARGDDVDNILGLELGADDYLSKPCNPRVIVAHLRAILRRMMPAAGAALRKKSLCCGDLLIEMPTRTVILNDGTVPLTSTEYNLLYVLVDNIGTVVTKKQLSENALGKKLSRYDRSLDMHISNLRKKLGPTYDGIERIKTVRNVGYLYVGEGA